MRVPADHGRDAEDKIIDNALQRLEEVIFPRIEAGLPTGLFIFTAHPISDCSEELEYAEFIVGENYLFVSALLSALQTLCEHTRGTPSAPHLKRLLLDIIESLSAKDN